MKAEIIKQWKQLEGVFDLGDIVEFESKITAEEEIIPAHDVPVTNQSGFIMGRSCHSEVIIPAGTYIETIFTAKNGKQYSGATIRNAIGYVPFSKWLNRIE